MPNKMIENIKKHVKENLLIYFIVVLCFLIGVSVGAFTVKAIDPHQKQELVSYLRGFFNIFGQNQIKSTEVFRESIINNTQLLILNWIFGLLVISVPLVLMVIGFKGFVIGFTVGLLLEEFRLYGVLLFLFGVLPQNIIIIPAFIMAAVVSLSFALLVLKAKINKVRNFRFSKQFTIYSGIHLAIFGILLTSSLIESFIVPFFIKLIVKYIL
ncbi:stage II sporulation protein M [Alkaliphilus transvaalensis]|uniref:stage II sporulation protein M n=1 Tax=Alkaliphilus transvaalensis TaxID=114628 RepID=UPI00047EC249|nr:stage II sporulation protein M [Alkaliphilus transvaalensis]